MHLSVILLLFSVTNFCATYTIDQGDRLWIDAMKSTAMNYYNRAWWHRQQAEELRKEALHVTTKTPTLAAQFIDASTPIPTHARIQMSQIFGRPHTVDDYFDN